MPRPYYLLSDWRRNTLLLRAATSLGLTVLPACSSGGDGTESGASGDWSGTTNADAPPRSFSQGVVTELTEVQPGQWKITAERPAGQEEVAAILRHFDGKVDTLQGEALQQQMQQYARQYPENRVGSGGNGFGMMDVLMWSGIGYMAGRFLTPSPGFYANPGILNQTRDWRAQTARERDYERRSFYGRGFRPAPGAAGRAGVLVSPSVRRAAPAYRGSAPRMSRSSGFGSRGWGGRGFGG